MIDIMALSPADLDRFIHLQALIDRQQIKHDQIRDLRDYYAGDHPILLTERQQEYLGPILTRSEFTFAHNVVKSIVDTLRERLHVEGFQVNGASLVVQQVDEEETPESQLASLFWRWWVGARLDAKQIDLYRRTLRDGSAYVIVGYDSTAGRPTFSIHRADDGQTGITYHLDPENDDHPLFACRYFYTYNPLQPGVTGIERKTVYLPAEIRKYIRRGDGWVPYQDVGDNGWPIPWRDRAGEPLGIAVIPFNNPGGSEVAQIIGLQNGLNKSWLDLLAAADAAGFPILAAEYDMDVTPPPSDPVDEDDREDDEKIAPGTIMDLYGGRLTRVPGADLSHLINVIWTLTGAISGVSRTPQYYLRPMGGSEVPSGEALKQLESGLVSRAEERHLIFGQSWEDVFTLAVKIAARFSPQRFVTPASLEIQTIWGSAEVRAEQAEATVAEIHGRLGVPMATLYRRLGYTPAEIASFEAERRIRRSQELAQVAATLQQQQRTPAPVAAPAETLPVVADVSELGTSP